MINKKILGIVALMLLVGCDIEKEKQILGTALFFDTALSENHTMSCATCHNPINAFVDQRFKFSPHPVHGAVSVGADGVALGGRNTPTAAYAMISPPFHYDNVKQMYVGGQFYDGRASTLKDQAMGPPTNSVEMQMPDKELVVSRIQSNYIYNRKFKGIFGQDIFDNTDRAYAAMAEAIEAYEKTDVFAPFDSKYDRFLDCKTSGKTDEVCYTLGHWSEAEKGGLKNFFDNPKVSCKNCHMLKTRHAKGETFSNYGYFNVGTPRNMELINELGLPRDYIDHGIYARDDINDSSLDGAMKVPTLRNIAVTSPYMSNGVFRNLSTVLEFYLHIGSEDGNRTDPRPNNPETHRPWGAPNVPHTINHDLLNLPVNPDVFMRNMEAFLRTLTDRRYEYLLR